MAVAAGSALRSVATKMRGITVSPRASPLHRALLPGGHRPGPTSPGQPFRSSSSAPRGSTPPPPINDKNLSQNKNVPGELHSAKSAYVKFTTKVPYFVLFGTAAFIYFWVSPRLEELVNEVNALRRERAILIKAVEDCQRTHIQAKGHGKEGDGQKPS